MAESRTDSSGGFVVDERVKEENHEAKKNHHRHHKETHGLRDDIDEETPITDVKAPNVFERAKEEIEAIVEAIHSKKETEVETHQDSFLHGDKNRDSARKEELNPECSDSHSAAESSKSPNLFERTKEDIEAVILKQKKSPHGHHKETHGTSNDIDENTPIDEVKGPSVFQRAKEELEAILDAIHPKKDSSRDFNPSTNKEEEEGCGGFKNSIGRGLEKICSPMNHHHSRD